MGGVGGVVIGYWPWSLCGVGGGLLEAGRHCRWGGWLWGGQGCEGGVSGMRDTWGLRSEGGLMLTCTHLLTWLPVVPPGCLANYRLVQCPPRPLPSCSAG